MKRLLRFLLAVVVPLGILMAILAFSPLMAVRSLDVTGNARCGTQDILAASGLENGMHPFLPLTLPKGGWPKTRLDAAEHDVERLPWVADARIDWLPLHTVRIRITEREPYARLPYLGSWLVVDKEGVVLETASGEALRQTEDTAANPPMPAAAADDGKAAGSGTSGEAATTGAAGAEPTVGSAGAAGTEPKAGSAGATGTEPAPGPAKASAVEVAGLKELRGIRFSGYANGRKPDLEQPENLDTGLRVLAAFGRNGTGEQAELYDAITWVDVLSAERVLVCLQNRVTVRFDPATDLQYTADFTREIFFRHIGPQEKGQLDFTRGRDPAFIPD